MEYTSRKSDDILSELEMSNQVEFGKDQITMNKQKSGNKLNGRDFINIGIYTSICCDDVFRMEEA